MGGPKCLFITVTVTVRRLYIIEEKEKRFDSICNFNMHNYIHASVCSEVALDAVNLIIIVNSMKV